MLEKKNLILFYPSFERGGVEKILENLIQKNTKFKITLISSKNAKKVINLRKVNFIEVTQKIKDAGSTLDIKLLDHLIITEKSYFSFADHAIL